MLIHQQTADSARKILSYTFAIFAVAAFVAMIVNIVALVVQPELTNTTWPVLLCLSALSIFTGFSKYSSDRVKINMVTALCLIYPPFVAGWGAGASVAFDIIVVFGIVLLYTTNARRMIYTVVPSFLISAFTFTTYNYGNGHGDTHTIHEIGSAFIVCSIILLLAYLHSKELRLNANMLEHAMIASQQGTIRRNFGSNTVTFDPVARSILDLTTDSVEWEAFLAYFNTEDREKIIANCGSNLSWNLELCFRDTCIDITHFTTSTESIWLIRDITEEKQSINNMQELNRQVQQTNTRLEMAVKGGKIGLFRHDLETNLIEVNDNYRILRGIPLDQELITIEQATQYVVDDGYADRLAEARSSDSDDSFSMKVVLPDGTIHYQELYVSPERDCDGNVIAMTGALIDVTEREQLINTLGDHANTLLENNEILELREKELLHLINHDHLTKILSRRGMGSAMRERFDAVGSGSVIAFDLDFFKPINDTYGHAAGDHVLRTLSQEVTRFLPVDCLFGRMGGEEFMIYTPKDNAYAYDLAHKLRAFIENINPTLDDGTVLHITSSFGVCGWIQNRTIDTMVALADKALYQSKLDGRNRVTLADNCFLEELHSSGGDISIADMEKALERGEFEYFVQPIIRCSCDGATQEVAGFEALMRWTTNPISPEIFIDKLKIALNRNKEARLIMQQRAVDVMIAVKQHFPSAYIAFNVDIERFATNDAFEHFTATWDQALQGRTDIKYSDIVLEISENAISNRVDQRKAVESMFRIKELGVQIALDDFGKASSNIARLNTYPVDILKIDKSFIDNIDIPNSMAFKSLSAIQRLAKDMNILVIAEGIEHQSQAEVCMTLGIRNHQGWLYSKAIPLERLAEFKLREKNSNFIDK